MACLLLVCFVILQSTFALACDEACPSDKPYCSEVGCVFQCPEPFYINGTNCISDCGDWFVDEHINCREKCPPNTYYKESLKQIKSRQYLERKCVTCSDQHEYIFNETCINVCPENSRHLDQNHCTTDCPSDRQFKKSITLFGLLHYKCVDECLSDNSFCTDICPETKFIFNSSCVEECPLTHPFMFSKTCLKECPYDIPSAGLDNKTCVNICPVEKSVVVNNKCVDKCPNRTTFITAYNGFQHCVESCEDGRYNYMLNCLDICPPSTVAVNNSCIEHCPDEKPLSCMIKKDNTCGQGPKHELDHSACVEICPQNMLLWKHTCVYSCPPGILTVESECAAQCPVDKPYRSNITSIDDCHNYYPVRCAHVQRLTSCVNKCPADKYAYNNTCLTHCPYPLVTNDNVCMTKCPITHTFAQPSTHTIKKWTVNGHYSGLNYQQIKQSVEVHICVPACKEGLVVLNLTCVSSCPDEYPFVYNQTCSKDACNTSYVAKTASGTICIDKCKLGEYVMNNSCVDHCPDTHFNLNETCVDHCPVSHLYTIDSALEETCFQGSCSARGMIKQCAEKCPNDSFFHQNKCLTFCDKPLLTYENTCLVSCPAAAPYTEITSMSVATWNQDGNLLRKSNVSRTIIKCAATCSYEKALLGTNCTDNCPVNTRYITNGTCVSKICKTKYRHYITPGIKCVEECPHDMFGLNGTCVLECPKDQQYSYRRACVSTCPRTHTLVNNETIGNAMHKCTGYQDMQRLSECAKSLTYDIQCRNECPEYKFIYNNTCVGFCSEYTSIFNYTCVPSCPQSHPFTQPSTTVVERWNRIHPYYFAYFGNDRWYVYTYEYKVRQCTSDCSTDYPYHSGYTCGTSCPETAQYSLDTTCFTKCPGDKLTDSRSRTCIDKCEDDKLYRDGECIEEYKCDDPMFAFGVLCLRTCPVGFVWFVSCCNKLTIQIAIAALIVALVGLGIWSRTSVRDFLRILTWINISEDNMEDVQNREKMAYFKTGKSRKLTEDEIPMMEDTHIESEADELFEVKINNDNEMTV